MLMQRMKATICCSVTEWLLLIFVIVVPTFSLSTATSSSTFGSSSHNMICVGGSSGMGKAAALETIKHNGKVLLISRSKNKLEKARQELLSQVPDADIYIHAMNVSNEQDVQEFCKTQLEDGIWHSLVISAAGKAPHGPMQNLPTDETRTMMETKVWTAYNCAKYFSPKLARGGAVVFVAGILNRRPGLNCVPLAMANGALEGLTRSLALEWGPRLRVNCMSPGFCDTERFDHLDSVKKEAMLANTAASLPLQRVGQPQDMGQALYYLATATFCTGIILDVDGGHGIRQYASPSSDPMRSQQ